MYKIGEFSQMAKVTVKTIRFYDEAGLLKPHFVDRENGYRYYTALQLVELHHIIALRQVGLSIEEIAAVLSGEDAERILLAKRGQLEAQLVQTNQKLSRIDSILSRGKEDFFMNYQATIRELPECIAFYRRGTIGSYRELHDFIRSADEECRANNPTLKRVSPDYRFVSSLDGEYRERDITVEYVQAAAAWGRESEHIKFRKLESTPAVCVYHKGGYERLPEAYAFVFRWMEQNGYQPAGAPREQYIDGEWNTENRDEWLTEIQIPISQ